jgi:uncharacterized membrane-anchored protein YjiN (DUF445 family)
MSIKNIRDIDKDKGESMNKEFEKLTTDEKLDALMDEIINIRDSIDTNEEPSESVVDSIKEIKKSLYKISREILEMSNRLSH